MPFVVVIKELECPECRRFYCAQCGVPWHVGLDCSDLEKLSIPERDKDGLLLLKLAKKKIGDCVENVGKLLKKHLDVVT